MNSSLKSKFDYIVIRPIWVIMFLWAVVSLFHKEWLMALFFVFILFLMGYVGGALHMPTSFRALASGEVPSFADAEKLELGKTSYEDAFSVTTTCLRLSWIIGIVAVVVAMHFGFRWWVAILTGIGVWFLNRFVMMFLFVIVAHPSVYGRIRSIPVCLMIFWSGIFSIVVIITVIARTISRIA